VIRPNVGRHVLICADSARIQFEPLFDLILTCPPFFHPSRYSKAHGSPAPTHDLDEYATWIADIFRRALVSAPGKPLCFVKTDLRYKNALLPLGFRIAEACAASGLPIRAHWVWERMTCFSPYAPSIANIFVVGQCDASLLRHRGVFQSMDLAGRRASTSHTPDLFGQLIGQLTSDNGVVLDPFAGTGSTVLAAARRNRWSAGVEIDPVQLVKASELFSRSAVSAEILLNQG